MVICNVSDYREGIDKFLGKCKVFGLNDYGNIILKWGFIDN